MFAFRPGIREIDVQGLYRSAWQQELEQIGGFDPHQPQIGKAGAQSFAVNLPQSSKQPFHGQQVSLGVQLRVLHRKRTVAAAQFHFQGLRPEEQFRWLQRFED